MFTNPYCSLIMNKVDSWTKEGIDLPGAILAHTIFDISKLNTRKGAEDSTLGEKVFKLNHLVFKYLGKQHVKQLR